MKTRLNALFLPVSLGLILVAAYMQSSTGFPVFVMAAPQACVAGPHSGALTADEEWCAKR